MTELPFIRKGECAYGLLDLIHEDICGLMSIHTRCHTPIPGPTRMADPNQVQGARLYTGTLYLFFLFFIFLFFYIESKYHIHI